MQPAGFMWSGLTDPNEWTGDYRAKWRHAGLHRPASSGGFYVRFLGRLVEHDLHLRLLRLAPDRWHWADRRLFRMGYYQSPRALPSLMGGI